MNLCKFCYACHSNYILYLFHYFFRQRAPLGVLLWHPFFWEYIKFFSLCHKATQYAWWEVLDACRVTPHHRAWYGSSGTTSLHIDRVYASWETSFLTARAQYAFLFNKHCRARPCKWPRPHAPDFGLSMSHLFGISDRNMTISVWNSPYIEWLAMKTQNYPTVTCSESSPESKCM